MNRSPLQTPKISRGNSLNAFDLSHRNIFSNSIGILRPCTVIHCVPNEKYEINLESFSRSQAINTSSFLRIKENFDFFFVPYRLLWAQWDNFITQQSNFSSSLVAALYQEDNAPISVPMIPGDAFQANGIYDYGSQATDIFGISLERNKARLFNALDYGQLQPQAGGADPYTPNDSIPRNPFAVLAYQKIYHDYFMENSFENMHSYDYNMDSKFSDLNAQDQDILRWFDLHYINKRKDYLTSIKSSFVPVDSMPYVSSFNSNVFGPYGSNSDAQTSWLQLGLSRSDTVQGADIASVPNNMTGVKQQSVAVITNVSKQISAAAIRAALALDKLAQSVGLASKTFRDQIEARYGIDVPKLRADQAIYLGSFDSSVVISEVTATNGDDLGMIGGKGTSSANGKTITFNSGSEFGVLMCLHYFSPLSDWSSDMIDRHNTKKYFLDYFQPELDNLGYQPAHGFEFAAPITPISGTSNVTRQTVGFIPRYMEYKTKLNKVYGAEFSNRFWTAELNLNILQWSWYKLLKVNPQDYNSQFGIAYNGKESTDQFICNAYFNIRKLSPMSVYGLPNLG